MFDSTLHHNHRLLAYFKNTEKEETQKKKFSIKFKFVKFKMVVKIL